MTTVIDIEGLRKQYPRSRRGMRALDGFDLSVAEGEIHGLLGPNASGKSTVLRALLGLVRADAGRMRIFDREVPRHLPRVLGAVGAVLAEPRFFPDFTARRTLRLLATAAGVKRRRVGEVLAQVGLSGNATERVGSFSRGMRQRLALAAALLKTPQLLILDEPCAGLDPNGIADLRDLLRTLADDGVTVLLASHQLADVQRLCDSVTFVARGQRIAAGRVADLLASQDKGDVRVRTADLTSAAKLIADAGLPVEVYDDHMVVSDIAAPVWITEALGRKRQWVSELTPLPPELESLYHSLAGGLPTLPGQVDQLAELSGLLDTGMPPPPEPIPEPAPEPEPVATEPAPKPEPAEPATQPVAPSEPTPAEPATQLIAVPEAASAEPTTEPIAAPEVAPAEPTTEPIAAPETTPAEPATQLIAVPEAAPAEPTTEPIAAVVLLDKAAPVESVPLPEAPVSPQVADPPVPVADAAALPADPVPVSEAPVSPAPAATQVADDLEVDSCPAPSRGEAAPADTAPDGTDEAEEAPLSASAGREGAQP